MRCFIDCLRLLGIVARKLVFIWRNGFAICIEAMTSLRLKSQNLMKMNLFLKCRLQGWVVKSSFWFDSCQLSIRKSVSRSTLGGNEYVHWAKQTFPSEMMERLCCRNCWSQGHPDFSHHDQQNPQAYCKSAPSFSSTISKLSPSRARPQRVNLLVRRLAHLHQRPTFFWKE